MRLRLFTDPLLVILEYAPGGNLRDYLRDHRQATELLSLRDLISFVYQVSRGMEHLSSMKVIIFLQLTNKKMLNFKCNECQTLTYSIQLLFLM